MSHFSRKSPLETPRPDAVSEREVKIQKIDTLDVDFPYNDGPSCWSGYEIRLEELIDLEKYVFDTPLFDLSLSI